MKLIIANWKLYLSPEEEQHLSAQLASALTHLSSRAARVVLMPSAISLIAVRHLISKSAVLRTGAQSCSTEAVGAFTGEISAQSLKSIGTDYVLVGHSERRERFGETDAIVARKVEVALSCGMHPILCCGENLEVRSRNQHEDHVVTQLRTALRPLTPAQVARVVIAYEPVWAIGTNLRPLPKDIQAMHNCLREAVKCWYGSAVDSQPTLVYGGNCNAENAASIFACPDVDGVLVGRASLCSETFTSIIQHAL